MTKNNKKCFVISPIGKDETQVRKDADDLLELIIMPALEIYDFDIIRSDMIQRPSTITDDIINLVQNADLCIIDLTGNNPNVFYECGRRHETAKPYIHIKKKGESLPFDIAGIRTIDYDLSEPRKIRESVEKIRKYINEIEFSGYNSHSSSFSLDSLANTLVRIERKIDSFKGEMAIDFRNFIDVEKNVVLGNPYLNYYSAIDNREYGKATVALVKFMAINSDYNLQVDLASIIVENYEPLGVPILRKLLDEHFEILDLHNIGVALFSLYSFYNAAMTLKNEKEYIINYANKGIAREKIMDSEKARLINVLASIEYSLKNYEKSIELQQQTLLLAPKVVSYYFNIATVYKILGNEKYLDVLETILKLHLNKEVEYLHEEAIAFAEKEFNTRGMQNKLNEIDEIKLLYIDKKKPR